MHLQIAISSQLSVTSVTKQAILLKHVRQESPRKANKLFRRALKAGMHNVEEGLSPRPEIADIIHIHTSLHIPRSYKVLTTINSIPVTMDIDTGAGVTIVSETTWAEKLNKPDLQDCSIALHSYPNRSLNVMGSCSVEVPINGQTKQGSWKVRIRSDADTDSDTDTSHFKIHFCIYITVNIHTYFC